jgi:hypothetical protein
LERTWYYLGVVMSVQRDMASDGRAAFWSGFLGRAVRVSINNCAPAGIAEGEGSRSHTSRQIPTPQPQNPVPHRALQSEATPRGTPCQFYTTGCGQVWSDPSTRVYVKARQGKSLHSKILLCIWSGTGPLLIARKAPGRPLCTGSFIEHHSKKVSRPSLDDDFEGDHVVIYLYDGRSPRGRVWARNRG